MGNFRKLITCTTAFDGDTIKVDLKKLKRKDAVRLIPMMGTPDDEGNFKVDDLAEQMELMDAMSDILSNHKYIVNFSGLFVTDENPETGEERTRELVMKQGKLTDDKNSDLLESLLEDAYFMPLLSDIVSTLMDKSFMKNDEVKKSENLPENTLADSVTTNVLL